MSEGREKIYTGKLATRLRKARIDMCTGGGGGGGGGGPIPDSITLGANAQIPGC